jgi:2-succinyl-6-hydroxy-2,4-cyclohexadiene-1-carboxylate synthase
MNATAMKGAIWCLHGAMGRAADWEGFSQDGWAVRRVDLWRFLDCCPMSMPEFGRALNAESLGQHGPEAGKRVLLGYSMGARLALHALLEGGGWDAVILVAPHPGLEDEAERAQRQAADAVWASRALSGDWAEFLTDWNAQPVLAGDGLPGREALIQRRREIARSFMDWSLGAQEALWQRLPEISCPVLWVVGERDAKFRALAERAVASMKSAEMWVAPGSGHRVPWEAAQPFQQKVGEFLEHRVS